MQSPTTPYDNLKIFVDALGGSLDDNDIHSAAETEGGKHLLAWLSHQAAFLDNEGEELEKDDRIWATYAILRDVALEKYEIPFRNVDPEISQVEKALTDSLNSKTCGGPSKLQKQAAFIKDENDLLQPQIDALTSRISKTKEASKSLVQSIKSLQRAIHILDAEIRSEEATITELSFNVDCTVSTTLSNAKEAFQSLGYCHDQVPHAETGTVIGILAILVELIERDLFGLNSDLRSTRSFLLSSRDRISRITNELRNALDILSKFRNGQSGKIQDTENETSRLQAAIHSLEIGEEDVDTEAELRRICLLLEEEASKNSGVDAKFETIATTLAETDDVNIGNGWVDNSKLNVQDILCHAWTRDQIASSLIEKDILDGAFSSLTSVVEPLQSLQSSISPLVSCIQEVEVVVEAFIEELAAILLPEADDNDQTSELEDTEMEENLRCVLSENQGLRPPGALPLVLMTRDDILSELQEIRNRTGNVEAIERACTEDFIRRAAARPIHAVLPRIYAHSPLHSSLPFAFPRDTQDLEARVRKMAGELQAIAESVEEEFQTSFARGGITKRLDTFVEKWTEK